MLTDYIKTSKPDITNILEQIIISCKMISKKVEKSQAHNLHHNMHVINYHGDAVKKLDLVANDIFVQNLSKLYNSVYQIVSEENFVPIIINPDAPYNICIDPLDGSSNIEACVTIGSIFGIYDIATDHNIIVSGYCLYSSSTIFVLCMNGKVNSYVLDKDIGEFVEHRTNIQIPLYTKIYSINHGLYNNLGDKEKQIIDKCIDKNYSMRYIGSMVADIHRTLLYGGIFMYPSTKLALNGKLRFYYEVCPLSHIIIVAGGNAYIDPNKQKCVLDHIPNNFHDCVPIFVGSKKVMEEIMT